MAFQSEEAGKTGTPRAAAVAALKWVENTHRGVDGAKTGLFTRIVNGVAALLGVVGLVLSVVWPIWALYVGFWWPDVLFVWTWFIIVTAFLLTFDLWYAKAYARVIVLKGLLTGGHVTHPTDPKSVLSQFRQELGFRAPQAPVSAPQGAAPAQAPRRERPAPEPAVLAAAEIAAAESLLDSSEKEDS